MCVYVKELVDLEKLIDDSEGRELRGLAREELSSCQGELQQIQVYVHIMYTRTRARISIFP